MNFLRSTLLLAGLLFSMTIHAEIASAPDTIHPKLNGQMVPANVTLKQLDGQELPLTTLLANKPTVIVFYRGGWCPYCNAQLAGLQKIMPQLAELGYQVIGISPEPVSASKSVHRTSPPSYLQLSDQSLQAMQAFGVAYYVDDKTEQAYRQGHGIQLTYDQTARAVLPVPAVFIVDAAGLIRFNFIHINYKVRLEPELLVQAAKLALPKT